MDHQRDSRISACREELTKQLISRYPVAVGVDTIDTLEVYCKAYKNNKKPAIVYSVVTVLAS